MKFIMTVTGFVIMFCGPVFAQGSTLWDRLGEERLLFDRNFSQVEEFVTLQDMLDMAVGQNRDLRARFFKWEQALHEIVPAKSLANPQLSYSYYIDEVETRVGAQKQSIGIMQDIPFPGKRSARGELAFQSANQKYEEYLHQKLKICSLVKKAYYEYAYVKDAIQITELNQKLLRDLEYVAQTKYKSGLASNQDLLKAQVELGRISEDLISLEQYRDVLVAKMKALLNWPYDREMLVDVSYFPEISLSDVDYKDAVQNPELSALKYSIEQGRAKESLAKLNYLPDFSVGVNYIETEARSTPVDDNGKDPVIAQFKVSLPIWFHSMDENLKSAQSFKQSQEQVYQEKENQLKVQIAETLYQAGDAQRKMALYKDALVPKADQALKTTETNYKSGSASFLDLIDTQRMLLAFQLNYYRAKANYGQSLAELELLKGGQVYES